LLLNALSLIARSMPPIDPFDTFGAPRLGVRNAETVIGDDYGIGFDRLK
jgi:hypothetical protein